MKGEFNDNLGYINFITTFRDNVALINIPMQQNHLVLISAERNAEIEQIVKNAISHFENNAVLGRRDKPIPSNNNPTPSSDLASVNLE